MKRTIIALLLLTAATSIQAQHNQKGFSLIPRIGINASKTTDHQYWGELLSRGSSRNNHKTDCKLGYVFGIDADYAYGSRLSTTLGLSYSSEGFCLDSTFEDQTEYLNFVNLSLLESFYVLPGFALKAGLQYGYLESAKIKDKLRGESRTRSNKEGYYTTNFSIPIGLSCEYKNFILDLRYNIGISNIYEYADDYRTQSLWLTLGYRFNL
jgi:hypothetical protein